jgi:hypothetical protein
MPRLDTKFTIANVIQIALIILGGAGMWFTIVGAVARNTDELAVLRPAVSALQTDNATFNTRLTVVESRAETQAKAMDKLSDAVDGIGINVQSLNVTAATTKTDVGYIRDFVESQKRSALP